MAMRLDHNFINWNAPLDDIRDHTEFDAVFIADLLQAQFCVQIKSPFISLPRLERLGEALLGLTSRGVRLCIFIRMPDNWEIRSMIGVIDAAKANRIEDAIKVLELAGAHINIVKGIHQKVAVIDGCIVHRGSLNILSFYNSEEEMMRKVDPKEALQATVYTGIDRCFCAGPATIELIADPDALGEQLARIRGSVDLSQAQLAELTGISQTHLSFFESGKRDPSSKQLIQIMEHLGRQVAFPVPPIVRYLHQIEQIAKEAEQRSRILR